MNFSEFWLILLSLAELSNGPNAVVRQRLELLAEGLPPEELLRFFPRWMKEQDMHTKVALFVAWVRSKQDDKFKETLFVSWMNAERDDRKLLKEIAVKATAVLVNEGFTKHDRSEMEHWIEVAVEEDGSTDATPTAARTTSVSPRKWFPSSSVRLFIATDTESPNASK